MKKVLLILTITLFGLGIQAQTKNDLNLVPLPATMKINQGQFVIRSNTSIVLSSDNQEMQNAVALFNNLLNRAAGFRLQVITSPASSNAIVCKLNPAIPNAEGYKLSVQKDLITLS